MTSDKCLISVDSSLFLMTLDAELPLSVIDKHEFGLGSMHAMTCNTCHRLTIPRINSILPERVGNLMLQRVAACTCLYTVLPEIKFSRRMERNMTIKTFPIFYRNTPNRPQCFLHEGCALLNLFMALITAP